MKNTFSLNQHDFKKQRTKFKKYTIKNNQPDSDGIFEVSAYFGKREVGSAVFIHFGDIIKPLDEEESRSFSISQGAFVHLNYRRQGVATAMYLHAEKVTGLNLIPAQDQTFDAKELWAQNQRPFGKKLK
jgi:GNAT superfamily N-acetyltransferase